MFRRNKVDEQRVQETSTEVKYPKPHILLMDIEETVVEHLEKVGFDISEGSFGKPYKIPARNASQLHIVHVNGFLPKHYAEKEVIIIDLSPNEILSQPEGNTVIMSNGSPFAVETPTGIVDPRPIVMTQIQSDFNRIYKHGGVFVIFADRKNTISSMLTGSWDEIHSPGQRSEMNSWAFLPQLATFALEVKADQGKEIKVDESYGFLSQLLQKHTLDSEYHCTLNADIDWLKERWVPLAENKFEKTVAGLIVPLDVEKGCIFIFPKIKNQAEFLEKFLGEYLPNVVPQLFPHIEGGRWVQRREYELPNVIALHDEIKKIQQEADARVTELEKQVQIERTSNQYMHDLITQTDDILVSAVEMALEKLGFSQVIDMDKELQKNGDGEKKREDLQIRDQSPLVLVEVKGISGLPKDSASLQVSKYLVPRMKALKRLDIRGLSVVNHQRNIPALDRKANPFSEDIVENALQGDFGLLTTWNLHKLLRNFLKFNWKHEQIRNLFYQNGFIEPIPSHFEYLGFVEHRWQKVGVIGIIIERHELQLGDTIVYDFPIEFEMQEVTSLQVDNNPVQVVSVGQLAGVLVNLDLEKIKTKTKIYRIKQT